MSQSRTHPRPGSRATGPAHPASDWEQEWHEAEALEREERDGGAAARRRAVAAVVSSALLAGLGAGILPLTPGFSPDDTVAAVLAAAVAAAMSVTVVLLARRLVAGAGRSALVLVIALASVGAAVIHLAVVKDHFEEYGLFGVFFLGGGIAQLVWPVWLLLRPMRLLLALGALGNALIVALWVVSRVWGLPLGPEHWKPEPVGFGDSAASAFELVVAAGCVALLAGARVRPLRQPGSLVLAAAAAAVTALALLSVLGVGSSFLTPTA